MVSFNCGVPRLELLLAFFSGFRFVEGAKEHGEFVRFLDLGELPEEDGCPDDLTLGPVRGRLEEEVAATGEELLFAVPVLVEFGLILGVVFSCLSDGIILPFDGFPPQSDADILQCIGHQLLSVETVGDVHGIHKALGRYPLHGSAHVTGDFFDCHSVCHGNFAEDVRHRLAVGALDDGDNTAHSTFRSFVRQDGVELAVAQRGFVDRKFLPDVLREQEPLVGMLLLVPRSVIREDVLVLLLEGVGV